MPRKTQTRRIDTTPVQGEGSWVEATSPKVGAIKRCNVGDASEQYQAALDMLGAHIKRWNWTDEEGTELAIPSEDVAVVDEMTNEEVLFLLRKLTSVDGVMSKN